MKYYSLTDTPTYIEREEIMSMAEGYWGAMPLPDGATLRGGYSDKTRAGALILLASGVYVCGNAGAISNIPQPGHVIVLGEGYTII